MKQNQLCTDVLLKRRRLNPDLRRAQLLEHAISAFADAGIERAAHADVASRANVSTPTVFKYFPSRDVLVDAVLGEVEQSVEGLRHKLPKDISSTSQVIRAFSLSLSHLCIKRPDLMKVALNWSAAFSPIRARYVIFEVRLFDILAKALNPTLIHEADKRIIFSAITLFVRMHFDGTSTIARRDYINRLCELMDCTAADADSNHADCGKAKATQLT